VLYLDSTQPTAIEERKVVAAHDSLSEIIISTSIPRSAGAGRETHNVELAILYGGSLTRLERPSATYFRYFVRLPRPLRHGEAHEVGVCVTIPPDQPINPRYALQPLRRCDEFDLRIRFGRDNQLAGVWNMAGVPRGMADDFASADARVNLDAAGEIHLHYEHLQIGFVYGARWETEAAS
jgi:hypothetical protein